MSRLIIVPPLPIAGVTASRGTGAANLLTRDPKEVWADSATGAAGLNVDLGSARTFDTVFVGYVSPPVSSALWSITGGLANGSEFTILDNAPLRVPDVAGTAPAMSHALYFGGPVTARFLGINLYQPSGAPLTAGILVIGKAFVASLGQEWGSGRQPIDTGTATALPGGGFAVVEGARKKVFSWTFGDLSVAEADQLDAIAGDVGETAPVLVVEDPDATAGLRVRIHYGLFRRWAAYERRNRAQTRWELAIEQWI